MEDLAFKKRGYTAHDLRQVAQEAVDQTLQKRSATDSSLLNEITLLRNEVAEMKETLAGWQSGTKIAFWIFVAIGGLITWILNTFGVGLHIGSK